MPVKASARKSLRASQAKQVRNAALKLGLKKALKGASETNQAQVVSAIDKAAKKGLIHPNKAARLKSALAKQFGTQAVKATGPTKIAKTVKTVKKRTKKTDSTEAAS